MKETSSSQNNTSRNYLPLIIIGGLVFIALCLIVQKYIFPVSSNVKTEQRISEIDVANTLRVTEVMSSNSSIIQDNQGVFSDWVELTNVSSGDIKLKGWKLAKDSGTMGVMVRHGSYISVYCNLSSVSVRKGQKVSARQVLGTIGTENILQFQLRKNIAKLNPESWIGR